MTAPRTSGERRLPRRHRRVEDVRIQAVVTGIRQRGSHEGGAWEEVPQVYGWTARLARLPAEMRKALRPLVPALRAQPRSARRMRATP